MHQGFWKNLPHPIIGLAPMDGVTDEPFRFIMAKYGKPAIQITEFTSVEGICAGATKNLQAFLFDESERPIVAQIFGSTPEAFYKSAFVVAELGFDGIDINMGCPAQNIASKGAGASLILTPELAKAIIRETKRACKDWSEGKKIEDVGLPQRIIEYVNMHRSDHPTSASRKRLPVSVKTRIGYNSEIVEEWIKHLLEEEPVNISLHGRTLKQMYSGNADWDAIAKAARLIHETKTTILGNGDIKNLGDAHQKIKLYGVDGVLIGRATFGNPWLFRDKEATIEEKFAIAIEHSRLHEKVFTPKFFFPMRKHLAWYCKGFPGASEIRQKLMQANNSQDVEEILSKCATTIPSSQNIEKSQ
jgi:nifR3 family TIM-barrel protein